MSGQQARSGGRSLTSVVLAHANEVHRRIAAAGAQDVAARLATEAQQFERDTTDVIIVGDIKRGKSSLINAIVERPGLLPVDSDVATSIHLAVTYGEELGARVFADDVETGERTATAIDVGELPEYASMAGDAVLRQGVKAVEVRVPHELLRGGLSLVDTPGVGGMTRGHKDITMAALARADALVFTVSAQEPVSRTELEFLAEASERIGVVIIAVTRSDLVGADQLERHTTDIRERILSQADRVRASSESAGARLAQLAGGPVVATSSYMAEQAERRAQRGQQDRAEQLAAASGIPDLRGRLGRIAAAKNLLRLSNLLQLIDVLIEPRIAAAQGLSAAADGDSSAVSELATARERLEHAASQQAKWRGMLQNAFTRLSTEAGRDVGRELTLVRDHYRQALEGPESAKLKAEDLEAISSQLGDSLTAAWSNLGLSVARRYEEAIADVMEELSLDAEPGLLAEFEVPPNLATKLAPARPTSGFDMLEDGLPLAMQTFMFSNIAGALVGVLGLATGGIGLLGYGIGAAIAAPITMMRRRQRDKRQRTGELLREINDSLFGQEGLAREFTTELTLQIIAVREKLEALIETRLVERRKDLETEHQRLTQVLRSEQGARQAAKQGAERELADLQLLRDQSRAHGAKVAQRLQELFDPDYDPAPTASPIPSDPRSQPNH